MNAEQRAEALRLALVRAWQLGQTYWQQADSESYKQNALSKVTLDKFYAHLEETLRTLAAEPQSEPVAAERERHERLQTVAQQVLRDMQAQALLLEWQTMLEDALRAGHTERTTTMTDREPFEAWWDSDKPEITDNPFRPDSAAYWAWSGWQAATPAERERCAAECDQLWEQHEGSTAYGCDLCATAIRKGPQP